jgi:hypothetical protein
MLPVLCHTLSTPGEFDEQDGLVKCVANNVTESQLRADVAFPKSEAGRQVPSATQIPDLDVLTGDPPSGVVYQVFEPWCRVFITNEPLQRTLSIIRSRLGVDLAVAFHVGLAGQNEHLDRVAGK